MNMARHLVLLGFLFLLAGIQIVAGNSADTAYNSENDNDEQPTTLPPLDPPIEYQFLDTLNKLTKEPPKAPEKEPLKATTIKETDDAENSEEEEEEEAARRRAGRLFQTRQGTSCGYHRLRAGQFLTVQSSNFNFGAYSNFEACTWRFFGQQCTVKAACPCFDVPSSSDCIGDYLKLTDTYSFALKFCGDVRPRGSYNSTTNNLKVRFRSDGIDTGNGFICYVTCTGPGQADPITPNVTCPASPNNPVATTVVPTTTTMGGEGPIVIPPPGMARSG